MCFRCDLEKRYRAETGIKKTAPGIPPEAVLLAFVALFGVLSALIVPSTQFLDKKRKARNLNKIPKLRAFCMVAGARFELTTFGL